MGGASRGSDGLTPKERAFCFAVDEGMTLADAYYAATPKSTANRKTASQNGKTLMKRPQVKAYLEVLEQIRLDRHIRDQDRVIAELMNIAFSDPRDIMEWGPDGVRIKKSKSLKAEQARQVTEVIHTSREKSSTVRIKLTERQSALDKLCRHFGLYAPEKKEVTGKDGGPIVTEDLTELSDVERRQRLARALFGPAAAEAAGD